MNNINQLQNNNLNQAGAPAAVAGPAIDAAIGGGIGPVAAGIAPVNLLAAFVDVINNPQAIFLMGQYVPAHPQLED